MENFKINNIEFTEDGIKVILPYKEDDREWVKDEELIRVSLVWTQNCVKARLAHCTKQLEDKLLSSQYRSKCGFVLFEDGTHFSVMAAKSMQHILECKSFDEFNLEDYTQAIKAVAKGEFIRDSGEFYDALCEEHKLKTIDILCECQAFAFSEKINRK